MMASLFSNYDITKISATGPGLIQAQTGLSNHFSIYFSDYSVIQELCHSRLENPYNFFHQALEFEFEGPSAPAPLTCKTNISDGSVEVSYTPLLQGLYDLTILFDGKHIPGSPFKIPCVGESINAHTFAVRTDVCFDDIACRGIIKVDHTHKVRINVNDWAIGGGLNVAMAGPKNAKVNLKIMEEPKNPKYLVTFSPSVKGQYLMYVKIADQNVPGSPFTLDAL